MSVKISNGEHESLLKFFYEREALKRLTLEIMDLNPGFSLSERNDIVDRYVEAFKNYDLLWKFIKNKYAEGSDGCVYDFINKVLIIEGDDLNGPHNRERNQSVKYRRQRNWFRRLWETIRCYKLVCEYDQEDNRED